MGRTFLDENDEHDESIGLWQRWTNRFFDFVGGWIIFLKNLSIGEVVTVTVAIPLPDM